MLVTNWLTDCRIVNLIDVTLACEDAYSKLVELLMLMMWIVLATVCWRLGRWGLIIKLKFCANFEQKVVKILELKFRQDFEAGVCSTFSRWYFVHVMKLNLSRDSEASFGRYFELQISAFFLLSNFEKADCSIFARLVGWSVSWRHH